MRAANGRPFVVNVDQLSDRVTADHTEALAAAKALRRGIGAVLACASFLVAAVGVTWYAPTSTSPVVQVTDEQGTRCGTTLDLTGSRAQLNTGSGTIRIPTTGTVHIEAKTNCND